jgi:hypothetical protein
VSILYVVLTHRAPADVEVHLDSLRRALPGRSFAVLYGGSEDDFVQLDDVPRAFVSDPTLRQPIGRQSYVEVLTRAYEEFVAGNDEVSHVNLFEFDHAIVDERYETELLRALEVTGADYLGRHCVDRTYTNWPHALACQDDAELHEFLNRLRGRADPELRVFGGVANAATISREALAAFVSLDRHLVRYTEFYVPTVLHYLGFAVADACSVSRVLDHARYAPPWSGDEIRALERGSVFALHPVKDYSLLPSVAALKP